MKYLIVQDWSSTHGNHAGMVHMCNLLKKTYPNEYEIVIKEIPKDYKSSTSTPLWGSIKQHFYINRIFKKEYIELCKPLVDKIQDNDSIFLLEYCSTVSPQYDLAFYLRNNLPHTKIYALSHLTPTFYNSKNKYSKIIKKWAKPIDKFLTLGSSLSDFIHNSGIPLEKISTGFHYVDTNFYHKENDIECLSDKLTIIVMGGMQRNFDIIFDVCMKTPEFNWILCMGNKDCPPEIKSLKHVTVKGYIDEIELKESMDDADISLNVMDDTIGSNVISTSLSMGLAMVCSNVGSIKDYCDNSNAIFCDNKADEFIEALRSINNNREKLLQMKRRSLKLSQKLSIVNVNNWFSSL